MALFGNNMMGGLAGLIQRRRAMRGSVFGRAMNTQPQGPAPQPLAQAATSTPQPQMRNVGAGQPGQPGQDSLIQRNPQGTPPQGLAANQQALRQQQIQSNTGMAKSAMDSPKSPKKKKMGLGQPQQTMGFNSGFEGVV